MSNEDREGTTCPTCGGTKNLPDCGADTPAASCMACAWCVDDPAPCPDCEGDGHARLVGANPPDLGIHEGGCHTCDGAGTAPEVTFGEFTCIQDYTHWVVVDDLWACAGDAGSRSDCEQGRCSGPHHKLILGPKVEI